MMEGANPIVKVLDPVLDRELSIHAHVVPVPISPGLPEPN